MFKGPEILLHVLQANLLAQWFYSQLSSRTNKWMKEV